MTVASFLDTYSGETTDELIARAGEYRVDSVVLAFEQAIEAKRSRAPISKEEEFILAVEGLEREVNNGGYDQFFINSSVEHVTIIVEALHAIGCPKAAAITAEAISLLGIDDPTPQMVEATAINRYDELQDALSACDDQYYGNNEPIADRLFEWIRRHRFSIRLRDV